MSFKLNRRTLLRGALNGAAVTVGLPLLDCFLNDNGTALANNAPLPLRFGTWFWALGVNPQRWVPEKAGPDYELTPELQRLAAFKKDLNVLSGFKVHLDGLTNFPHAAGPNALRTGVAAVRADKVEAPTLDILIAEAVGAGTRFKSLEITGAGDPKFSLSMTPTSVNPSEVSPVGLYTRIFGPEFQDPNAADFKPDPEALYRKSVLSAVKDSRQSLMAQIGSSDRVLLDQYFTSIRQLEQQLDLRLQKPPPAEACVIPKRPGDSPPGEVIDNVVANHKVMSGLLALALACNQTKVFNVALSGGVSGLRKAGSSVTFHTLTHEEQLDKALGYQPEATWFIDQSMQAFATFLQTLASVREGDGTLLDNCLLYAHSDVELGRTHSLDGIPLYLAGKAGGRMKTGLHIKGGSDSIARVGLTVQQLMGLPIERWGSKSMETNKPLSEIMA